MDSKNNTANSIDQTLKQFSKIMLTQKIFDCAMCEKLLTPPIMLIENTGNICSNCFKKTNEKKNAIRNEPFEKILAETVVPCDYGCKENIVYKELDGHHAKCKCRPVKCLLEHCQQLHPVNNYVKHFTEKHPKQIFDNEDGIFLVNINISCDGNHLKLLKKKNNQFFLNVTTNTKMNNILFSIFTENNVNDNTTKKCKIKLCGMNNTKMNIECEIQPLRNISDENKATKVNRVQLENVIGSTNYFVTLMIKSNENELTNVLKKYMECPVCIQILRPPIYLCTDGHSICSNCQSKMSYCPTCRGFLDRKRNYCLEAITKELLYECMYRMNGCEVKLAGDEINRHEQICLFKNGQHYYNQMYCITTPSLLNFETW